MLARFIFRFIFALSIVLSACWAFAETSRTQFIQNSPVGHWRTVDDKTNRVRSILRVWESHGEYYGTIEKIFKEPGDTGICSKCPGAFRDKPILGMTIIWGLEKTGDHVWSNGSILDPVSGKIYRVSLTLSEDGRSIRARGYIGFSLFGRTQNWYRSI